MAASYAADHADEPDGLVLLAAYSTRNLTGSGLAVLSVYGSEDGVLDMEKYEQYRSNLPAGASEVVIDGGCHAGFGRSGAQDGDGTPAISSNERLQLLLALLAGVGVDAAGVLPAVDPPGRAMISLYFSSPIGTTS